MGSYSKGYLGIVRTRRLARVKRAGVFLVSAAACLVFMMYVSQRVRTVEMGYGLEDIKAERAELAKANELLRVEAATLSSPARIEEVAGRMLGMKVPSGRQVVLVREVPKGAPSGGVDDGRLVKNSTSRRGAVGAGG